MVPVFGGGGGFSRRVVCSTAVGRVRTDADGDRHYLFGGEAPAGAKEVGEGSKVPAAVLLIGD
jgi:hypothetical protein